MLPQHNNDKHALQKNSAGQSSSVKTPMVFATRTETPLKQIPQSITWTIENQAKLRKTKTTIDGKYKLREIKILTKRDRRNTCDK